jgi:purine-cytosine permease-like protein
MANAACGVAGLICVIIAGWTTANPTIYRAGLAFQEIIPKVSRFKVTLITGAIATIAGLFPGIAMKLLGFVALYGMVLMPMGAVIFVDFWLLKRLGLKSNFAELKKLKFSPSAGIAWFATFIICLALVRSGKEYLQIYFVSLPGWFVAAFLYTAVSFIHQREIHKTEWFRLTAKVLSWGALVGIVVPGVLFLIGQGMLPGVKIAMTTCSILWFITTPLWMELKE